MPNIRVNPYLCSVFIQLNMSKENKILSLLNAVIDSQDSGLALGNYIHNYFKNKLVTNISAIEQPEHASSQAVMIQYEINNYQNQTERSRAKDSKWIRSAMNACLNTTPDLKSPFSSTLSIIDMMSNPFSTTKLLSVIGVINRGYMRMINVVTQLLDINVIESSLIITLKSEE